MEDMVRAETKVPRETWAQIQLAPVNFSAQDALAHGIIHRVGEFQPVAEALWNLSKRRPRWWD